MVCLHIAWNKCCRKLFIWRNFSQILTRCWFCMLGGHNKPAFSFQQFLRGRGRLCSNCGCHKAWITFIQWHFARHKIIVIHSSTQHFCDEQWNVVKGFVLFHCSYIPLLSSLIISPGGDFIPRLACGRWEVQMEIPVKCSNILPCPVSFIAATKIILLLL